MPRSALLSSSGPRADSSSTSSSELNALRDAAETTAPRRSSGDAWRFALKLVAFLLILAVGINVVALFVPETNYQDIFRAIRRAEQPTGAHTLILGDSVARQMFTADNELPGFRNLATNQAVSMVGQYILAARTLENGKQVRTIALVMIPRSLRNDLDQHLTFNYFVRPFYRRDFKQYLSPTVYERLGRKPYWIVNLPVIRKTWLASEIDYSNGHPERTDNYLSPTSAEYLRKLRDLAASKSARVRVIPVVISRAENTDFDAMRSQVHEAGLDDVFEGYFEHLEIADESLFTDGIHLNRDDLVEKYRTICLDRIRQINAR
jgi:hypothetical protein